jgi:tryptophanyl-tRNA synthetase
MSLQEADKKMSKSDENENAYISLLDSPETIQRKFKRAVTDSDGEIRYSEDKPGVSNLISIYSAVTGKTFREVEEEFAGKGYGALKSGVADAVVEELRPLQERYAKVRDDKAYLADVMKSGAQKAYGNAVKTLRKVQHKVGLASRE